MCRSDTSLTTHVSFSKRLTHVNIYVYPLDAYHFIAQKDENFVHRL